MTGDELRHKADWVRRETLRLHRRCPETRLASSLSCVEILTVLHYGGVRHFDPARPLSPYRDRFVVSKGHGSISFYPILADLGFIDPGELSRVASRDGVLKVIPDTQIAGYETINGSLGHGAGMACGIALYLRETAPDRNVFVLLGDGELNEGSVWEAIMFAGHHRLHNLIFVVDKNGGCMLDFCRNVLDLDPLPDKFRVFGWDATTVDGHDVDALRSALLGAVQARGERPCVLIAETVKGKGVPWLETDPLSHIRVLRSDQVDALLGEGT